MSGNAGSARDNRQRGNAAQLLEKYKSLARDAQLAGDRVQTEYYLQFADHYFRVLGENRPRVEDQRSRGADDDDGDELEDENLEANGEGEDEPRGDLYRERSERGDRQGRDRGERDRGDRDRGDRPFRAERFERDERAERPERPERFDRADRPERAERSDEDGGERRERVSRDDRPERTERRPRRERTATREREQGASSGEEEQRLPQHILPPSIGVVAETPSAPSEQDEAPAPRRRTRRVRPVEDEGEIAPAA
jgi:hypothetical protein